MNLCVKAAQTHLEVASGMSPEDEFRKNYWGECKILCLSKAQK
jgi:hypothetical protein